MSREQPGKAQLAPRLVAVLDATGLPWDLEYGGKHVHIRLAGRLAGVAPRSGTNESDKRAVLNTISQVRRLAAELTA